MILSGPKKKSKTSKYLVVKKGISCFNHIILNLTLLYKSGSWCWLNKFDKCGFWFFPPTSGLFTQWQEIVLLVTKTYAKSSVFVLLLQWKKELYTYFWGRNYRFYWNKVFNTNILTLFDKDMIFKTYNQRA